ncbi:acylphosphatase [bacterium]|nr:MAG: acylphosphatase [bacterium]
MEKERVHVLIKGQVQGVFFRSNTKEMASALGLSGCVRNLLDGSVEAIFEGPKDKLKKAVQWCHKGPPGASVTQVDEKWIGFTGEFDSFNIAY